MQTGHSANHLHEGLITAQTSRYLQIVGSFDLHPPSAVSHSFTFCSLPLHPPSAVSHFIHLLQSPTSSTFCSLPLIHPLRPGAAAGTCGAGAVLYVYTQHVKRAGTATESQLSGELTDGVDLARCVAFR